MIATNREIINVENILIPKALSIPEGLKYVRNSVLDILREYDIEKAGIRITETTAQRLSIQRIEIEGVIQEAFASSKLSSYYRGQISNISSRINIDRSDFKKFVKAEIIYEPIENWNVLSKEERESVFVALGAEHCLI